MSAKIQAFETANKESPITLSKWLDKNKKTRRSGPATWMFKRIRLANGAEFVFDRDEDRQLGPWEKYRWAGVNGD